MDYEILVETYDKLDLTTKRLEKTYHTAQLLIKSSKDTVHKVILLLQGKVFPTYDERKIGVSSKYIAKAINIATGADLDKVHKVWKETGDLGNTAEKLVGVKSQSTLFSGKLSVEKVFNNLQKLALIEGSGSVDRKLKLIAELLTSASPIEAKYIARTVLEDLRLGIGEGTLRDAIVWAFLPKPAGVFQVCPRCHKVMPNIKECLYCTAALENKMDSDELEQVEDPRKRYNEVVRILQNAYDLTNDFGQIAKIAKEKGLEGLKEIDIDVGTPIKVTLYPKAKDFKDAFERVGKPAAIEYKYDGFRVQCHKKESQIELFTRRLEDVTNQFPELVEEIKEKVDAKECVFDAEIIGINKETGTFLPFQHISQRIRRKHSIDKMAEEIPVVMKVFDVMELEGKSTIKKEFKERRQIIEKVIKKGEKITLSEHKIVSSEKEAEKFYEEALNMGEEGVMMKKLSSPYVSGRKVGHGVKIKPAMETLDLVVVEAEWGEGKRSDWLSSFTVACQDDEGNLLTIGKVSTGLKEISTEGLSFEDMTKLLKPLIKDDKKKKVKVKPEVIIEVEFEEIQKSPSYSSGFALRFPRVVRLREDKPIDEISTRDQIEDYYHGQN